MDGWAFAQAYERLPDLHVPVIVMTAARDAAMRAAEVKAAAYLAKPFQLADLYACIAHWGKPGVTARRSVVARGRWPRDGPHAGRRRGAA
jgi:CheY-like chemotaxis protein